MTKHSHRPDGVAPWWVLAILLVPTFSVAAASSAEAAKESILGPRIGPVSLGFTQSQVEAELGQAERVVPTGAALDPELRYPGFTIWLRNREKVMQLRSSNPKYCLPGNVCPGASAAGVLAAIGPPQEGATLRAGVNTYAVLFAIDEFCWAEVTLEKNLVSVVEIKCEALKSSR
jgi:hypothetical protein